LIKPKVYLAGPIRGAEDYVWRKDFVTKHAGQMDFLIPSDVITRDMEKLRQFRPAAYMTYRTDLDLIDRCDMVVMNLLAHEEGYPARGTLFELGYARAKNKLIIAVVGEKTGEHPFIAFGADGVYKSFEHMEKFLDNYLQVLNGGCPWFEELKGETK
jgi:nucleoside 2-deoxyribosyltransferase